MKKIIMLILFASLLCGCSSQQKTASVHHPPVPNKPPRIPETPAVLVQANLFPHPDQGEKKARKRKTNNGQAKNKHRGQSTRQRKDFRLQ